MIYLISQNIREYNGDKLKSMSRIALKKEKASPIICKLSPPQSFLFLINEIEFHRIWQFQT
jgi:hypothetical protein